MTELYKPFDEPEPCESTKEVDYWEDTALLQCERISGHDGMHQDQDAYWFDGGKVRYFNDDPEPEIDEDEMIRCMCDHDIDAGGNCRYQCGYSIDVARPATNYFVQANNAQRVQFEGGGMRDSQEGKPRFDLLVPEEMPFDRQYLTRCARLLAKGAAHYEDRNWEKFGDEEALNRARSSAFRHFMQWFTKEDDEDHAASVFFNIQAAEYIAWKLEGK